MEYCPGIDLALHLAKRKDFGYFNEAETRFYISELILAIEYLHSHNIIYRDLKCENILISSDGHVKLTDFGLAKSGIQKGETASSFCGSPAYLSPEMLSSHEVGFHSDIYGIGTVIYELLTGDPPYYHDDAQIMY